jgi:hypothetical protein
MRARRKGEDLPLYTRTVVEEAIEKLPDPEGREDTEYTVCINNLTIVFLRVPTTSQSGTDGPTFWKYELLGRVQ